MSKKAKPSSDGLAEAPSAIDLKKGHRQRVPDRFKLVGGDIRLLHDIFVGADNDPLGRAAGHLDGATSILTGIAANKAFKTGEVVKVADLLKIPAGV